MRMIPFAAATVAALAASNEEAAAQAGPSFDCDDASTLTEFAICGSPRLSSLERDMVGAYEGLVARIGETEARRIADRLLVERQACEGDLACIETMLTVSAGAFGRLGTASSAPLSEAIQAARAQREAETAPDAEAGEPPLDLPELVARERAERDAAAPPEDFPAEAPPAVVAAPQEAAPSPTDPAADQGTPLAQAFASLPADQRLSIERQLGDAGLLDEEADGEWSEATEAALGAVVQATGEDGSPIGVSDVPEAAVLLDFVASEAFRAAQDHPDQPMQFNW